ncbi:DAK2 domain-containing protein [Microbispora cellulosiformans]|uniref:DAK2 domain-containing protein n=2 Tax=Microbispora TaxID=2005 RepID=A0A5J5K288_9ACTN|nr:DAK2 domain-containing protein [Microbispora cellulosiformans]KAA9377092.1 DAK2 domain-containing protein [Microbispora cellulosiformans]
MLKELDPPAVRRWSRHCATALGRARAEIDALNVFPVPDGDTGTNLHLTLLSAADALDALPAGADGGATWAALARGALLGARGNSGVIVSQALKGLADTLGPARGDGADLRAGLARAAETARAAVARPVEGTLLTVLSAAARAVRDAPDDLAGVARLAAEEARRALRRTTGQLDVLSRNGVVDAGAAGLVIVLESLAEVVTEAYSERHEVPAPAGRGAPEARNGLTPEARGTVAPEVAGRHADGPGYEVMYLLDAGADEVSRLRAELDALGDSLVIVGGEALWNVHVHVDDAGAAIEAGLRAGRPHRIKVTWLGARPHEPGPARGVVAVAAGDGLAGLFAEAGAVVVRRDPGAVPPVAALVRGIRDAGAEVAVLPNDAAVYDVAVAAAEIAREEGATVSVLPTRASVQGLAALAVHDPLRRFDDDIVAMTDAAGHTRHGHVWVADRAAVTSAGLCRPGEVLGVVDGEVALIGADLAATAVEVARRLVSGGSEMVTLVVGAGAPPEVARAVEDDLERTRPDLEIVVYEGGQGGYPLLIGAE